MTTDEREDLRSVPDVDIAKLVQMVENKKKKNNLSEVDLRPNTFKKIDEEGIYNPGKLEFSARKRKQNRNFITSTNLAYLWWVHIYM